MNKRTYRTWWIIVIVVLLITAMAAYYVYNRVFKSNVITTEESTYLYVPTGTDLAGLTAHLKDQQIINNANTFLWTAEKKRFSKVIPGKYLIEEGMSNNALINLLRSGKQEPVMVTFNNVFTKEQLAGKLAKSIEADSLEFIFYFDTATIFKKLFISQENILTIFIPDTYEFYWNTSAEEFVERMLKEHEKFWKGDRADKAASIGLTPQEVYTLASIVYAETKKADEAKRVAGVYMNRLRLNIPLQADPTLKFALGDFTIQRILKKDMSVNSPYNTYKYTGLPPGPICMPPRNYLEAVLNYEKNDYIFFCAKEDFSGYHNFAVTLQEHNRNAKKYQDALNKSKIYR
ncbi:MAG: endolytic transglycosylase MltG [Bacteroidetes bacterium]|nr:endolytic transglycosylase MltG [Bacteroidota bacterium]MBP7398323.1 endolytic transglycosylase MltG [Chitinophagales bacterium]MBK8487111.1 endolytic transglycosylase MltG [Bacteroidota bacterium]MBP8753480.1 endolytic transglycosylase MltG [Chitinophagales bacterium]MBP9188961.1 endolytic transglycosylase MltG [Chitinophagales bacterium]